MELDVDRQILSLVRRGAALGAEEVGGPLSDGEQLLLRMSVAVPAVDDNDVEALRREIIGGNDPLGTAFERARERAVRRRFGQFYTDPEIVSWMVAWALSRTPARVVDAGCGSGRFAAAVVRRSPGLPVLAIDTDPVATIITRANLAALGTPNVQVVNDDFTTMTLPRVGDTTAFVGNPPYVRHHELTQAQKHWVAAAAQQLGHKMSKLAGLHAHFFLATALHASNGDIGAYITSAEWLDTNYGAGLRELLLNGLGMEGLHVFNHSAVPFADAMSTGLITCFEVGKAHKSIRVQTLQDHNDLRSPRSAVRRVRANELAQLPSWGSLLRDDSRRDLRESTSIRLGDVARVHRGAVTGCNDFFVIRHGEAAERGLLKYVRPVLTSAVDVLESKGEIRSTALRYVVLAPPKDIDLTSRDAEALVAYLAEGERRGVPDRYVCSHRKPWWYVGFSAKPAPIVATYMARQPPTFAANPDGVLILNVLHGIFPNRHLQRRDVMRFVDALNASRPAFAANGRFYHGGLQKLEPREMEAMVFPSPL
jgi:methylase of polypeptide subunit release factors